MLAITIEMHCIIQVLSCENKIFAYENQRLRSAVPMCMPIRAYVFHYLDNRISLLAIFEPHREKTNDLHTVKRKIFASCNFCGISRLTVYHEN